MPQGACTPEPGACACECGPAWRLAGCYYSGFAEVAQRLDVRVEVGVRRSIGDFTTRRAEATRTGDVRALQRRLVDLVGSAL